MKTKEETMYREMIRETLARIGRIGVNPRYVEAWMRSEHGTLDALDRLRWTVAVREAVACADAAGEEMNAAVAASYAL